MTEYKVVCDIYEKHSKAYGGNEYHKIAVTPIFNGRPQSQIITDYDRAKKWLDTVSEECPKYDIENNAFFTEDGYRILRMQANFRIVSREVSDWK